MNKLNYHAWYESKLRGSISTFLVHCKNGMGMWGLRRSVKSQVGKNLLLFIWYVFLSSSNMPHWSAPRINVFIYAQSPWTYLTFVSSSYDQLHQICCCLSAQGRYHAYHNILYKLLRVKNESVALNSIHSMYRSWNIVFDPLQCLLIQGKFDLDWLRKIHIPSII